MKKSSVRILHPENPLTALVNRSGGLSRERAIAQANQLVENQRGLVMEAIDGLITELEVASTDPCCIYDDIRRIADRIVNLASLFGLEFLVQATAQLCDGIAANSGHNGIRQSTIAVYVRAIRLLGPRLDHLSDHDMQNVIDALQLLVEHFGIEDSEY